MIKLKALLQEQKQPYNYGWSDTSSNKTKLNNPKDYATTQTSSNINEDVFEQLYKLLLTTRKDIDPDSLINKLATISTEPVRELALAIMKLYDTEQKDIDILKSIIILILRESKASVASYFHYKEILGWFDNTFRGGDRSQGYGQITPSTAKQYNIDMKSLYSIAGTVNGLNKMILENLARAKQYYSGPNVTIWDDNKFKEIPALNNDAALHMMIVAHNAGAHILTNWYETDKPGRLAYKNPKEPYKDGRKIKTPENPVLNYFPKIKSGENSDTHTYIKQIQDSSWPSLSNLSSILSKLS